MGSNDLGAADKAKRIKSIMWAVITVVALAGVILVIGALGEARKNDEARLELTATQRSDRMYSDGMAALESGETTEAVQLFTRALELDPANERASAELDKINKPAQDTDNDGGGSTNPTVTPVTDPDAGYLAAAADLTKLLPVTVSGYELGMTQALGTEAQVPADPTTGGPLRRVKRVVFVVHDRGDATKAKAFVSSVSRTAYPQNAADMKLNGIPAYFGTDGSLLATIAFTRGRFAFEVLVTSDGPAPGTLLDDALAAAAALPASR